MMLRFGRTARSVYLEVVEISDADYIHSLRMDSKYNRHLSRVSSDVKDQVNWIRDYKEREAAGSEYYFKVIRCDNDERCGTLRVYDIREEAFTWGSWILDVNKPPSAAFHSALNVYDFGFFHLRRTKCVFDVRRDNIRTLAFHDRFGARRVAEDDVDVFYELTASQYLQLFPEQG